MFAPDDPGLHRQPEEQAVPSLHGMASHPCVFAFAEVALQR
jgi:hypothetical protein